MVNEDILTALKNGVQKGESLETSIKIAINSGYNPREVKEAANYVGKGTLSSLHTKPTEHLAMPSKKSFFSFGRKSKKQKNKIQMPKIPIKSTKPIPSQQTQKQTQQQIKQSIEAPSPNIEISSPTPSTQKPQKPIKPKRTKEIILLVTLLTLIGVLVFTIIFKDRILSFFTG
ncbi:hypothetical protein HOD75_05235 [archaeon]|jgi:hypothetical protein|nr:hypothetical protein [Candidatus Woesearchaeota archaeon]MBT4136134.1 hypothetical protein [archaeon]MBT4242265.1 hypothetical protein [archaeon]MBT4417953.1 hypothetical protein [archaeon]